VNMRWARQGQNQQHNISKRRFAQIVEAAQELAAGGTPVELIRIGIPEKVKKDADLSWIREHDATCGSVDIFADACNDEHLTNAIWDSKLFQPYFWRQVCRHRNADLIIGMIGGRSGSMDIASFMGLRTASWDRVDAGDQNYMRLHWAAPFNTVISDTGTTDGLMDYPALVAWMAGNDLVPVPDGDPSPHGQTLVGTAEAYAENNAEFNALWFPPYG
jgi:hypothetical protein